MSEVEFKVDGHVAIMSLNRPEAKNALNAAVWDGLGAGFAEVKNNPEIRVVVLTGEGGTFSSGMDLKAFAAGEKIDTTGVPFGGADNVVIEKPIIAAVEGYAVAGGFELALLSDIIVASEKARFGLPEVKLGLAAAAGGLINLASYLPPRIASELVLTGDMCEADLLYRHGLINHMTPAGGALDKALEIANKISKNGPMAVSVSRKVMKAARDWPSSEAYDLQKPLLAPVFASNDAREGAISFAEKRAPKWTGT